TPGQQMRLEQGATVIADVYGASYSYKRILDSDLVLEFPFELSEYIHNQRLSNSTFNLIEMRLRTQPAAQWPALVAELNQYFTFPLQLLEPQAIELADDLKADLMNGEVVWQKVDDHTDYLYRRMAGTPFVIKMGSFDAPLALNYLLTILIMSMAFLVALAVLYWVYPLWRDLKRLRVSAEAFGEGDFSARATLPRRSVLRHLSEAFNGMAQRIQRLISSHKELTNAVSHELRTPIARLRFGMEMLQSARGEADRARYLRSMSADIDELDQLVAELLTYARFDRDRPALKFRCQPVAPWLAETVRQARIGNSQIAVEDEVQGEATAEARFEPRLMARALGNLLQNAQRYARRQVRVSFSCDDGVCQLCVDDDGPGIPPHQRQSVFEAFKRLDASRDRDTGGYGLGLAIVQRISQWHGGTVSVTDSPLGGARFTIRWPVTS
ncbi:MAG TPA: HAMP domain-containing protein, partial [Candidatus Tenderia sp.]|nr:HAMP domain-containing protein [Candidatus Tenderia sp.]